MQQHDEKLTSEWLRNLATLLDNGHIKGLFCCAIAEKDTGDDIQTSVIAKDGIIFDLIGIVESAKVNVLLREDQGHD